MNASKKENDTFNSDEDTYRSCQGGSFCDKCLQNDIKRFVDSKNYPAKCKHCGKTFEECYSCGKLAYTKDNEGPGYTMYRCLACGELDPVGVLTL